MFSLSILNIYFIKQLKAALTKDSPSALSYFFNLLYKMFEIFWGKFF
jgi:hypothetical protein